MVSLASPIFQEGGQGKEIQSAHKIRLGWDLPNAGVDSSQTHH